MLLKKPPLFSFLIDSNIHISFCAAVLTFSYKFTGYTDFFDLTNYLTPLFIFFSTLLVYTVHQLLKHENQYQALSNKVLYIKTLTVIISSFFCTSLGVELFTPYQISIIAPFAIISLMYSAKVLSSQKNNYSPRELPYSKIFLITTAWVFATKKIPELMDGEFMIDYQDITLALFIFAITIPFDIRDLNIDKISQKTIPSILGIKKSILLSQILLITYCGIHFIFTQDNFIFFLLFALVSFILVSYSVNRPKYYYTGILDGLIMLKGLVIIGSKLYV
jgi:hypothetical protein